MPTKDLALFSIHTPQKTSLMINDEFLLAEPQREENQQINHLRISKWVVQLFAPSTNPVRTSAKNSFYKSGFRNNLLVSVHKVCIDFRV